MTVPTPLDPVRVGDEASCRACEADALWLNDAQALVARIADEAGLPEPGVQCVPGALFTACVEGYATPTPTLIFDEKARRLTTEQLAGVTAHEIGHIAHQRPPYRTLSTMSWWSLILGAALINAALLTSVNYRLGPGLYIAAAGGLLLVVAFLARAVLHAKYRSFELLADAFARELGYGPGLVRFLAGEHGRAEGADALEAAIRDARAVRLPLRHRFRDLFTRTHPRYHVRIAALANAGLPSSPRTDSGPRAADASKPLPRLVGAAR